MIPKKLSREEDLRLKHAKHNEDSCSYLGISGAYPDWEVTTSFYSAVQYTKYKLFPLKDVQSGDKFDSFDEYKTYRGGQNTSPHTILKNLIKENLPQIRNAYYSLFDACHTARYNEYRIDQRDVNLAKGYLAEIKKQCDTNKPSRPRRPRRPG